MSDQNGLLIFAGIALGFVLSRVLRKLLQRRAGAARPAIDPARVNIDAEVRELARSGKTIEAIKLLRERSGLGLKDAKDAIDRLG